MSTTVTYVPGLEWNLGSGTWPDQSPMCKSAPVTDFPSPVCSTTPGTLFKYADTEIGFLEGPRPLVGATTTVKPYIDTVTVVVNDLTGKTISVTATRVYYAYELTEMDNVSSLPASPRQFDPNFIGTGNFPLINPTQYGGCILYHEMLGAKPLGFASQAGVADATPTPDVGITLQGLIQTDAQLAQIGPTAVNNYVMSFQNGDGFLFQGDRWFDMDVVPPILDVTLEVQTVMDLPCETALGVNAWVQIPPFGVQSLPLGVGGAIYYSAPNSNDDLNLDPFPEWFQCTDPAPTTISGYVYLDVFDRAEMSYVRRCSNQMDDDYVGEISIKYEGYFPTQPLDPNFVNPMTGEPNPLYPMDSVTRFIPDPREKVTVTYTVSATCVFAGNTLSETITVYQDVLAPQEDWPVVLNALLNTCYFTHGYYWSYNFLLEPEDPWSPRPDPDYIPMDDLPIRNCELQFYQDVIL